MPFITVNELRAAVAAANGMTGPDALPAQWPPVLPDANDDAYQAILSVLGGRGFTPAQIAAWDYRVGWSKKLGVCQACWRVSKSDEDRGEAFRREWKELLEELKTLAVVINGEVVNPTGAGTRISTGAFTTTDDRHTMDDTL